MSQSVALPRSSLLFGNQTRTGILVAVRLLEESYPSELAEILGVRLFAVQRALATLEGDGVIVSRMFGRTRRISLNPRYTAQGELSALLWKLGQNDSDLQRVLATRRRRPRRAGKPGLDLERLHAH